MSEIEDDRDVDPHAIREASVDLELADRLDVPASALSIYLEEASVYRPILTGDVFRGVEVPGSTEQESGYDLTMIVGHPSAMREGPKLADRVQASPVFPIAGVRRTAWTPDRFDIFPLPCLRDVAKTNGFDIDHRAWAGDLRLAAPISSGLLDVRSRVACLSAEGVVLLLQRLVHCDTRAAIRLDTLEAVFLPKLNEAELLESWTEEILTAHPPDDLPAGLAQCAQEFDAFLDMTDEHNEMSLRTMLGGPRHQPAAERLIWAEIERRT